MLFAFTRLLSKPNEKSIKARSTLELLSFCQKFIKPPSYKTPKPQSSFPAWKCSCWPVKESPMKYGSVLLALPICGNVCRVVIVCLAQANGLTSFRRKEKNNNPGTTAPEQVNPNELRFRMINSQLSIEKVHDGEDDDGVDWIRLIRSGLQDPSEPNRRRVWSFLCQ